MIPGLKTADGALYVTTVAPAAGDPVSGGVTMSQEGWVRVNANAPQRFDQGKGFLNSGALCIDQLGSPVAGYVNGLPVTATGALKCQLNQSVSPGDAYVGGLRVGPLGGLYIVDAAPVWTPANLFASGEQGAWYDPSDFSTMFQDSAGTTPVTAVGQPVGKILDKSGRNNHATQATAASRPVLRQDANSKYYLEFDGVDDSLATAAIDFTSVNKTSIFAGTYTLDNTTWRCLAMHAVGTAFVNPSFGIQVPAGSGAIQTVSFPSSAAAFSPANSGTTGMNTPYVFSSLADRSVATRSCVQRRNASEIGAVNWAIEAGFYGNNPLRISGIGGERYYGRLYSLIVRGAASTTQEITDTETWVNSKTGAY
jgi:hypothetical protein